MHVPSTERASYSHCDCCTLPLTGAAAFLLPSPKTVTVIGAAVENGLEDVLIRSHYFTDHCTTGLQNRSTVTFIG